MPKPNSQTKIAPHTKRQPARLRISALELLASTIPESIGSLYWHVSPKVNWTNFYFCNKRFTEQFSSATLKKLPSQSAADPWKMAHSFDKIWGFRSGSALNGHWFLCDFLLNNTQSILLDLQIKTRNSPQYGQKETFMYFSSCRNKLQWFAARKVL